MSVADPDAELVLRAQTGEFAAFEELLGRHEKRVFAVARHLTGRTEDAEDVTQETFLSALRSLGGFRGESLFSTWLSRIATNHALKLLRKRRGLPTVPLAEERDDEPIRAPEFIAEWREGPEEAASRPETRAILDRAMEELDEKHRVVFVMRDVEGMTTEETAEALGITPGNVKIRLLRARLALRESLTRSLGDETRRVQPRRHE